MTDPVSSTPNASSLVYNVDARRLVDVRRQMISPPSEHHHHHQQQQPASVRQSAYTASTSLSTLPMPDVVRESVVDDLPTSVSPAAHASSLHPAMLVILQSASQFLSRDAMHKRGLCRRAVSVCLSVRPSGCLSRSCILSKRVNIGYLRIFFTIG